MIILEPGEEFEHYHSGASTSTLKEGTADIRQAGRQQTLIIGETITTPAMTSHTLINTGTAVAAINYGNHAPHLPH
ncbi:cupin domain-containing protein [Streptomyces sp. NPDC056411]|uniref:cupin domain-containing protein n=1 Tax=Streptomyces sp. NPDC056411 TaxID=3345813 RepID=UPI0035D73DA3